MERVRVEINGRTVNVQNPNGLPIGLTYAIDDPDNPGKVAGSRSERALTIVADKAAQAIWGDYADATQDVASSGARLPARVEADGLPVFRGYAQLIESDTRGGRYGRNSQNFRVALIGNNAGWFVAFQAMKVADVLADYFPAGTDFTNTWAATKVNAVPGTDKYGLFLARTKDWQTAGQVRYAEHTFFVFIADLLRDAFARAGYILQSDFFDSEEGSRLIHAFPPRPVPKDYGAQFELYVEDNANTTALPNPLGGGLPALIKIAGTVSDIDPNDYYDSATGYYTVQFSGHYTLTWGGTGTNFYTILDDTGTSVVGVTVPPGQPLAVQTVFLTAGTRIGLHGAGPIGATAGRAIFQIQAAFDFGENYTIDPAILTDPDWLMSDLLLGAIDALNLQLDTDIEAGTVRVEPSDAYVLAAGLQEGFYQNTGRVDITPRLDLSRSASYQSDSARKLRYRLEWEADNADPNAKALEDGAELPLYSARYNFPANRYQEGEDVKTVRYWKKTVAYRANEIRHSAGTKTPLIPLLQTELLNTDGTGDPVTKIDATEPRMLFYGGRRGGVDGYVKLSDGSSYDPPMAWFVNYADDTGEDFSLAFGNDPTENYTSTVGLLSRFHLQKMARWRIGRTAEEYAFWRPVDVLGLDFRKKVLIHGSLWLLKTIENYVPGRGASVKTVIEYDTAPNRDDKNAIENTPLRGIAGTL